MLVGSDGWSPRHVHREVTSSVEVSAWWGGSRISLSIHSMQRNSTSTSTSTSEYASVKLVGRATKVNDKHLSHSTLLLTGQRIPQKWNKSASIMWKTFLYIKPQEKKKKKEPWREWYDWETLEVVNLKIRDYMDGLWMLCIMCVAREVQQNNWQKWGRHGNGGRVNSCDGTNRGKTDWTIQSSIFLMGHSLCRESNSLARRKERSRKPIYKENLELIFFLFPPFFPVLFFAT